MVGEQPISFIYPRFSLSFAVMRKLTHAEIAQKRIKPDEISHAQRIPVSVIVDNVRSLYNVGSIFRTSDGLGVKKLWLCGITGHPPHPQLMKTALGAEMKVVWEHHPDVYYVLEKMKEDGYQIILLEQTDRSIPLDQCEISAPVCLVLGNEIEGVSERLLSLCDRSVEIEMDGMKNSLNVAVAFGIAAHHFRGGLKNKARY